MALLRYLSTLGIATPLFFGMLFRPCPAGEDEKGLDQGSAEGGGCL